jgi:hypothetical protein
MAPFAGLSRVRSQRAIGLMAYLRSFVDLKAPQWRFPLLYGRSPVDLYVPPRLIRPDGRSPELHQGIEQSPKRKTSGISWSDVQKQLEDSATGQRAVVILGRHGQGKTLLSQFACRDVAMESLRALSARTCHIDEIPLPIWTTVYDVEEAGSIVEAVKRVGRGQVEAALALRDDRGEVAPDAACAHLAEALRRRTTWLFLDAMDERPDRASIRALLSGLTTFPGHVVLTCRPQGFDREFLPLDAGLVEEFELAPLTLEQQDAFVEKWFPGRPKSIKRARGLIDSSPIMREIASNGLILTLICAFAEHSSGAHPTEQGLYEWAIDDLLRRAHTPNSLPLGDPALALRHDVLIRTASALSGMRPGRTVFTSADWHTAISSACEGAPEGSLAKTLTEELVKSGLLVTQTPSQWRFLNQALFESLIYGDPVWAEYYDQFIEREDLVHNHIKVHEFFDDRNRTDGPRFSLACRRLSTGSTPMSDDRVMDLLEESGRVLVRGPAGAGKTVTLLDAFYRSRARRPRNPCWLDARAGMPGLRPGDGVDGLAGLIARSCFGIVTGPQKQQMVKDLLVKGTGLFLILDDLDLRDDRHDFVQLFWELRNDVWFFRRNRVVVSMSGTRSDSLQLAAELKRKSGSAGRWTEVFVDIDEEGVKRVCSDAGYAENGGWAALACRHLLFFSTLTAYRTAADPQGMFDILRRAYRERYVPRDPAGSTDPELERARTTEFELLFLSYLASTSIGPSFSREELVAAIGGFIAAVRLHWRSEASVKWWPLDRGQPLKPAEIAERWLIRSPFLHEEGELMRFLPELRELFRDWLERDDNYRQLFPRALAAPEYRASVIRELEAEFDRTAGGVLDGRFVDIAATSRLKVVGGQGRRRGGREVSVDAVGVVLGSKPVAGLPGGCAIAIIGEPGSGKTTCLLRAAIQAARSGSMLPVYVPLRGFQATTDERSAVLAGREGSRDSRGSPSLHPGLFAKIRESLNLCGQNYDDTDRDLFLSELARSPFLFLFDGLDEVDWDSRYVVRWALQEWAQSLERANASNRPAGSHRLVVSTRKLNFNPGDLGFTTLELEEMGRRQIREFLARYLKNPRDVPKVLDYLDDHPQVLGYAQNPRWLFYLTQVFNAHGALPRSLGRLLDEVVAVFLGPQAAGWAQLGQPLQVDAVKRLLIPLACRLQESGGVLVGLDDADTLMRDALVQQGLGGAQASAVLDHFDRCGILRFDRRESGTLPPARVRFRDKTVQEYLAARRLASTIRSDGLSAIASILDDVRWQEAVALLPGLLSADETRALVERLLSSNVILVGRLLGNAEHEDRELVQRIVAALARPVLAAVETMRWIGLVPLAFIIGGWTISAVVLLRFVNSSARTALLLGPERTTWEYGLTALIGVPLLFLLILPQIVKHLYWRLAFPWLTRVRETILLPRILALRSIGSEEARRALQKIEERIGRRAYHAGVADDNGSDRDPLALLWRQILTDIEAAREVVATNPAQLVAILRKGDGTSFHLQQLLQVDLTMEPIHAIAELVKKGMPTAPELLRQLDSMVVRKPEGDRFQKTVQVFRELLHHPDVSVDSKWVIYRSLREIGAIPGWAVLNREFIVEIAVPGFASGLRRSKVTMVRFLRLWRWRVMRIGARRRR